VYVSGGGVATVNAVLTPIVPGPTPDVTGQVVAASVPPGADFLLDNVYKGVTPLTLADIPAGSHVVTMKEAGYTDNVQTVTVVGGQSTAVAATLTQPTPAPTPTKSPMTVMPVVGAVVLVGAVLLLKRGKE
jgi:hypothetical protein